MCILTFVLTVHVDFGLCVRLLCVFTIQQSALAHLSLVRQHFSNTVTQIVAGGGGGSECSRVRVHGWVDRQVVCITRAMRSH